MKQIIGNKNVFITLIGLAGLIIAVQWRIAEPDLLVSTSGLGHGRMNDRVAKEVDFILIHFNGTKVEDIPKRINALKKYNKPIVCNEDDKIGEEAALALRASVKNACSWGFMYNKLNQYEPFEFNGYHDDPGWRAV